ncbi:MAG: tRNA uridine-5-carboxymethylaminomethyl(34) synthesis GTPase MnmE, partial [Deltaproteobacteria bacterium]|nr:tRNA uridine-5-carboxymethylaminomethyl(34) synthesis GTPase MnmE [Deltaproteobacteria bacterium]
RIYDLDDGSLIDEVMYYYKQGPNTATGEDVAEIHTHGGNLILKRVLELTYLYGCRPAKPGEYTLRAYKNGKMDLTQSEAVMSLIGAKSTLAAKISARQLSGGMGKRLSLEYDELLNVSAFLEAGLDYPDEDLPLVEINRIIDRLKELYDRLNQVSDTYKTGLFLSEGAKIVIAGPSNAGKSSILNSILQDDRALVHSEPGTTRDIVEASFEIGGIPVTFYDTAGFRVGAKTVELAGIKKSREAAEQGDLLIIVIDSSCNIDNEVEQELSRMAEQYKERTIIALNKCDIKSNVLYYKEWLKNGINVSAKSRENLNVLLDSIENLLKVSDTGDVILTTSRQQESIIETSDFIEKALDLLLNNKDLELVTAELRWARDAFASLWGRHTQSDVFDKIFSTFCLGK